MSKFKIGDRVQWKDAPCSDKGEITYVCNFGGITVFWDSQPFEEYYYTAKDVEKFELFQKPADLPKYVIVQGKVQDVVAEVEQYMKQGYKPQGGVSMHQDWFAQAMILED